MHVLTVLSNAADAGEFLGCSSSRMPSKHASTMQYHETCQVGPNSKTATLICTPPTLNIAILQQHDSKAFLHVLSYLNAIALKLTLAENRHRCCTGSKPSAYCPRVLL